MRKPGIQIFIIATVLVGMMLSGGGSFTREAKAEMARVKAPVIPGRPPEKNPHPPRTAAEKRRVFFAMEAARFHLGRPLHYVFQGLPPGHGGGHFQTKDQSCLKSVDCYGQDQDYVSELVRFHDRFGELVEVRFAHVIPWSWKKFQARSKPPRNLKPNVIVEAQLVADEPMMMGSRAMMQAPQLQSDEFMVHAYVKFKKDPRWYHLDIILTENSKGEVGLRHFFTLPIPSNGGSMPPGVVC